MGEVKVTEEYNIMALFSELDLIELNDYDKFIYCDEINELENLIEKITANVIDEEFTFQCETSGGALVLNDCVTANESLIETIQVKELGDCNYKENFIEVDKQTDCTTDLEKGSRILNKKEVKRNKIKKKYMPEICTVCQKNFSSRKSLRNHEVVHLSKRPFVCRICGKAFKRKSHLSEHDKWVHKKQERTDSHNKITAWKAESGEFCCDKCDEIFANKFDFFRHTKNKHKNKACDVCNEHFSSISSLYRHKIQHTEASKHIPNLCHICGKVFSNIYFFKTHLKNHLNEKEYLCEVCGKNFVLQCYLNRHMMIHSDCITFTCHYCGKILRTKYGLNLHIRCHTGEKPYVCDVCNRGFTQLGYMKKHKVKHQARSREE